MQDDIEDSLDSIISGTRRYFYVPPDLPAIVKNLEGQVNQLTPPLREIGSAFIHNIQGAVGVASIPFALASASAQRAQHHRIYFAERIRARGIDPQEGEDENSLKERRDREAAGVARERITQYMSSTEGKNAVIEDTCRFLLARVQGELEDATSELINQATVLLWGAFEILARDAFVGLLNSDPGLVQMLMSDRAAGRRFDVSRISLDVLAAHNFNISSQMGEILGRQQDMSDLVTIRAVYAALFPGDTDLHGALNDRGLWHLSQDRHLIVHRRGYVDDRYVQATGSTLALGTQREVSPAELDVYLELVRDSGLFLLNGLRGT